MTTLQPIEAVEHMYRVRSESTRLRDDSGGPGRWRGGLGLTREVRVLVASSRLSVLAEKAVLPPFGVCGGAAGATHRFWVRPGGRPTQPPPLPRQGGGFPLATGARATRRRAGRHRRAGQPARGAPPRVGRRAPAREGRAGRDRAGRAGHAVRWRSRLRRGARGALGRPLPGRAGRTVVPACSESKNYPVGVPRPGSSAPPRTFSRVLSSREEPRSFAWSRKLSDLPCTVRSSSSTVSLAGPALPLTYSVIGSRYFHTTSPVIAAIKSRPNM